jgi:hypothetical protein
VGFGVPIPAIPRDVGDPGEPRRGGTICLDLKPVSAQTRRAKALWASVSRRPCAKKQKGTQR